MRKRTLVAWPGGALDGPKAIDAVLTEHGVDH